MVVVVNCVYHCEKVAKTKSYGVWLASKTNKHPFQKLKRKKKQKQEFHTSHLLYVLTLMVGIVFCVVIFTIAMNLLSNC